MTFRWPTSPERIDSVNMARGLTADGANGGTMLGKCEVCGNEYDKAFTVTMAGRSHTYDSFECAIHALAPSCAHCGCRVVGHGVEAKGKIFCCGHCAEQVGAHPIHA